MISYKFGDFRLDVEKRKLLGRSDEVIPLTPRVFDLLLVLVESGGRVLTKGELLETVWVDCIVEESNLSQDIFILRKALGDASKSPQFIRTIPNSGYRFISPVTIREDNEFDEDEKTEDAETIPIEQYHISEAPNSAVHNILPENEIPAASRWQKIKPSAFTVSFAIFSAVLLLLIGWNYLSKPALAPINSIAVLPFTNVGNDANTDYLTNGLTQNITNRLARLSNLKVVANSMSAKYVGIEIDPMKVGRELNVIAVLVGRIEQEDDLLDVHVELIEVSGGKLLWGENYKRKLSDVITLRDEITRNVYENLNLQLPGEEETQLTKHLTDDPEAFQSYLRGRHHLNKRDSRHLPEAAENFLKAVSLDPDYSVAYSGLAMSYVLSGVYGIDSSEKLIPNAKEWANKALSLDANNEEALTVLAFIAYRFEFKWTEAEKMFKRAIEINSNNITVHHWFGEFLNVLGRTDEGLQQQTIALELDPFSHTVLMDMAVGHYLARRYDKAIEYANRAVKIENSFAEANYNISEFYQMQGKYAESVAEWKKVLLIEETEPKRIDLFEKSFQKGGYQGFLKEKVKWLEEMRAKKSILPTDLAKVYTALDNKNKAIFRLEEGLKKQAPNMVFIARSPAYDKLRDDKRFQEILQRMNLEPFEFSKLQ